MKRLSLVALFVLLLGVLCTTSALAEGNARILHTDHFSIELPPTWIIGQDAQGDWLGWSEVTGSAPAAYMRLIEGSFTHTDDLHQIVTAHYQQRGLDVQWRDDTLLCTVSGDGVSFAAAIQSSEQVYLLAEYHHDALTDSECLDALAERFATVQEIIYVWVVNISQKYHRTPTCSGMKNPTLITLEEANKRGISEACNKCCSK